MNNVLFIAHHVNSVVNAAISSFFFCALLTLPPLTVIKAMMPVCFVVLIAFSLIQETERLHHQQDH
jgi:hypothetical protein